MAISMQEPLDGSLVVHAVGSAESDSRAATGLTRLPSSVTDNPLVEPPRCIRTRHSRFVGASANEPAEGGMAILALEPFRVTSMVVERYAPPW